MGALLKYLLLALVVVWLLYSPAVRGRLRGQARRPSGKAHTPHGPAGQPGATPTAAQANRIEPCAHCGVHLPVSEALHDLGGRIYCSEAHRLAGPRTPDPRAPR